MAIYVASSTAIMAVSASRTSCTVSKCASLGCVNLFLISIASFNRDHQITCPSKGFPGELAMQKLNPVFKTEHLKVTQDELSIF